MVHAYSSVVCVSTAWIGCFKTAVLKDACPCYRFSPSFRNELLVLSRHGKIAVIQMKKPYRRKQGISSCRTAVPWTWHDVSLALNVHRASSERLTLIRCKGSLTWTRGTVVCNSFPSLFFRWTRTLGSCHRCSSPSVSIRYVSAVLGMLSSLCCRLIVCISGWRLTSAEWCKCNLLWLK